MKTGTVETIIKIQVPLNRGAEPLALLYNEDHSLECLLPLDDDLLAFFQEGELKVYVEATFDYSTGDLTLHADGKLTTEPEW